MVARTSWLDLVGFATSLLLVVGVAITSCGGTGTRHAKKRNPVCHWEGREDLLQTSRAKFRMYWSPGGFPLQVEFERGVPVETRLNMVEAVDFWNQVLGSRAFAVTSVQTRGFGVWYRRIMVMIRELGTRGEITIHGETNMSVWHPLTGRMVSGTVSLDPGVVSPEDIRVVGVHELGHVLGLGHDQSHRSVMFRSALQSWGEIENRDIEYIRDQMGLPPEHTVPRPNRIR